MGIGEAGYVLGFPAFSRAKPSFPVDIQLVKSLFTWHCVKGGLEGAFGHILLVGCLEVELVGLPITLHIQGDAIIASQVEI